MTTLEFPWNVILSALGLAGVWLVFFLIAAVILVVKDLHEAGELTAAGRRKLAAARRRRRIALLEHQLAMCVQGCPHCPVETLGDDTGLRFDDHERRRSAN